MRPEQRHLWLLPWTDERNAIACAMQVSMLTNKRLAAQWPGDDADILNTHVRDAATLLDTWHQKSPGHHDKAMIEALNSRAEQVGGYDIVQILRTAATITKRALLNDLRSNDADIMQLMSQIIYTAGAADFANDAMAKWRFYDATGRNKMDDELRAAFEAYWLAGEYAAGYAFVGAHWPAEWNYYEVSQFSTSVTFVDVKKYTYGLIRRNVQ